MSAFFPVSLLFVGLRLCKDQAACAQPVTLGHSNRDTIRKGRKQKIQVNHIRANLEIDNFEIIQNAYGKDRANQTQSGTLET